MDSWRQSGRTTVTLKLALAEARAGKSVVVVTGSTQCHPYMLALLAHVAGSDFEVARQRIRFVAVTAANIDSEMRGVDPQAKAFFFDHYAYEEHRIETFELVDRWNKIVRRHGA